MFGVLVLDRTSGQCKGRLLSERSWSNKVSASRTATLDVLQSSGRQGLAKRLKIAAVVVDLVMGLEFSLL